MRGVAAAFVVAIAVASMALPLVLEDARRADGVVAYILRDGATTALVAFVVVAQPLALWGCMRLTASMNLDGKRAAPAPVAGAPQPDAEEVDRLARRLVVFYRRYHPAKLADPDFARRTATRFAGREAELWDVLGKKYVLADEESRAS